MLQCFTILKPMVRLLPFMTDNNLRLVNFIFISNIDSILTILKDPSFEHSQPSWVRRSPHSAGSVTFPTVVMLGSNAAAKPLSCTSPLLNFEEVDYPLEEGAGEIVMEFQEDEEKGEKSLLTMVH
jgi:hypothetical protein